MNVLMSEFIGTMLLILLGNGVVANVVLRGTKGNGSGWLVITMGWAMAVFAAVLCSGCGWKIHGRRRVLLLGVCA
jgi:glycerol uptake facilitator protein